MRQGFSTYSYKASTHEMAVEAIVTNCKTPSAEITLDDGWRGWRVKYNRYNE